MPEEKKPKIFNPAELVTYGLLLTAAFVFNLLCLFEVKLTVASGLAVFCNLVAVNAGAYYSFMGYRKEGHYFYTIFVGSFAFNHLCMLAFLAGRTDLPAFLTVSMAMSYGALCVLAVAKNLGRKKTFFLCGTVCVLKFVPIITFLIQGRPFEWFLFPVASLLVAMLLNFAVKAKYTDKVNRNRKV